MTSTIEKRESIVEPIDFRAGNPFRPLSFYVWNLKMVVMLNTEL